MVDTEVLEAGEPAEARGRDDEWIPSSCAMCYGTCSILAHRVDGVVVKIEGNPDSVVGKGKLCGKGVAGIMTRYDPNRLKKPLRRTNPKKGFNEDPGWKEIGWDEALDEIAGHLKRIRAEDPRKLIVQRTTTVTASRVPFGVFAAGFGTPNYSTSGGGLHCGNGAHLISGMMHASWSVVPDFPLCDYAIYFGASKGHAAGHASCSNMGLAADARVRGMRMVVVDPMANFAGAKADEWVPLRVGTDAALALGMCNVIANELQTIDAPYLKEKTNAPYLLGADGFYARDEESGEPLVWNEREGKARPYNSVAPADMALEGAFDVGGQLCCTVHTALRDHLKKFTPEWAEEISTVPAGNVRRLAREFAEHARIGSTIVIDGVTVPYRPVAAIAFRGSQGHLNSAYNFLAIDLLNHLVGAADVAGSCLGFNPACDGYPETGKLRYRPKPGPDGLMEVGMWMGYHHPYPVGAPRNPERLGLQDLFTMGMTSPFLDSADREDLWSRFDIDYRPEMLLNFGANFVMSIANSETVARGLAELPFMVSIDLFLTETSQFADIVLPDCDYLQSVDSRSNFPFIFSLPAGMGEWCWPIRQPVVEPDGEQRPFGDVLLQMAERAGFLPDLLAAFNASLELDPPHRLDPNATYSYDAICDADLKDKFGADHGLDWFKENGVLKWKKKPQEAYWRAFTDVRVPIYWEWMPKLYDQINAIAEPRGLHVRREFYDPLPDFIACPSHECRDESIDLYAFYYRDIIHTNSYTMENPWLDEAARLDPFSYTIAINASTGRAKGLKNGDKVRVETETGRHIAGRVRLSEGVHPEGLGIAACAGHWGDGMPIAKGKGLPFNELLELDWEHTSPLNLGIDVCAKVRVVKLEAQP